MNRLYVLAATALTLLVAAPVASATDADLPPLVGFCVDGVRDCWGSDIVCVGFSYQVPQCVEDPGFTCTETCNPCMTIECEPASEPMCMYYYYEIDTGIVRYVQRDSCHSEIYVMGQRIK